MSTTCTGHHFSRDLPSEGERVWLMLCTGCREASLIIGHTSVGTFPTADEAETNYKTRITGGQLT